MATVLDKELKRQVTVDGAHYMVVIGPEGIRLTGKGKRKPEAELQWRDLLSGEAALAVALNASLAAQAPAARKPKAETSPRHASGSSPRKRARK